MVTIAFILQLDLIAADKDLSFKQYFLVPENAVNNDYCGKFELYFTLEDSLTNVNYQIVSGNSNNIFSINSSGQIIISNQSALNNGQYILRIRISDNQYEDIDTAIIDVIDVSKCVFIDPTFSGSSNGSRSNPYKSWRDANAPFAGGKAYFQKRNTISYEDYISIRTSGTTNNRIKMGAYGSGNLPVLDGNEKTTIHNGITVGAYEPETIIEYVNIYDLEVMEYSKYGVRLTIGSRDVELHRVYAHNNGSAGGSGIKCENRTRAIDDLPSEHRLYSVRSVNNDAHGIKFAGGNSSILNAYCSGNGGNGISALGGIYQNIRHCFVQNNTQFGIKITCRYSSIKNVLSKNNYMGVFIGDGGDGVYYINANDIDFRDSYVVNNRTVGVYVGRYVYNINVEKNVIRNNQGSGINIGEDPTYLTFQKNDVAFNGNEGIYINSGGSGFNFYYNAIYYNESNGLKLHAGSNIKYFNNTHYNNFINDYDIYITNDITVNGKNNIYRNIGGYVWSTTSDLIIQNDNIFVDAGNYNFHLKSTATSAIDKGVNVNLNEDKDGNFVPHNSAPDKGCYEFYTDNSQNPPSAPSNLTGTALSYESIRINWTDNSNWETSFIIQRRINNGSFIQIASLGANSTSFIDYNLSEQTNYSYRVYARNAYGNSGYSNVVQITTPENTVEIPPQSPTNLTATNVSEESVALAWTDNSSSEDHFVIEKSIGQGSFSNIYETDANIHVYSDADIEPGTSYRYRIYAYNEYGNSGYSNTIIVNVPENTQNTPPIAPTNLFVSDIDYNFVELTWIDNANNEEEYVIQRSVDSVEFVDLVTTEADTNKYIDTEVSNGNTYYYRIFAVNEFGNSEYSEILKVDVPLNSVNAPNAPSNLFSDFVGIQSITFAWTDNSSNETGFIIYKKRNDETSFRVYDTIPADLRYYIDNQVEYQSTYIYKVRAYNEFGVSEYSNSIATLIIPTPQMPTNLTVSTNNYDFVELYWEDNDEYEVYYQIERKTASDEDFMPLVLVMKDCTSYIDEDLQLGETYEYRARSRNKAGLSLPSNIIEVSIHPYFITKREREGIIAEYLFEISTTEIIKDISGFSSPLDLKINDEQSHSKGQTFEPNSETRVSLQSIKNADKIIDECQRTNEITIECWIRPEVNEYLTESTILAVGRNNDTIGFLLRQHITDYTTPKYSYYTQTSTNATVLAGYPRLYMNADFDYSTIHHIVYTRSTDGNEYLYLNGLLLAQSYRPDGFDNWQQDFMLSVANNLEQDSKWDGDIYYMAIFSNYQDEETIKHNYSIGPSDKIIDINKITRYEMEATPNPTRGNVNISIKPLESNEFTQRLVLVISDIVGSEIYRKVIYNPSEDYYEQLDLGSYKPGSYYISLIQDEHIITTLKLIILK